VIGDDPFETGLKGFRFWRRNELGKKLLRRWFPRYAEKRESVWAQRAARKAARPRQPDEGETFQQDEVTIMLPTIPNNTMRKTGVGLMGFAPVLAVGLGFLGIGDSCSPEAIEMGCRTANEIAGAILGGVGAVIYVIGSIRADKRSSQ
jgi:hypothetical protein